MANTKNNAKMIDTAAFIAAGMDPKTGLPLRNASPSCNLKPDIKRILRIIDEQDFVNRFQWHNLPRGINAQLLERILYYRGTAAFFYIPALEQFFFLPYTLNGQIDCYGRFTGISPMPFMGSTQTNPSDKPKEFIPGLALTPQYDILLPTDLRESDLTTSCVLLHDYTPQLSQTPTARADLQDSLLDTMADIVPFTRTSLLNATGVSGIRVNGQEGAANIAAASMAINNAALRGEKYIPIVDQIEFQDMTAHTPTRAEDFLVTLQALDNLRLSTLGLDNGGLFQKKAHLLQDESNAISSNVGLILQDSLEQRQNFCTIINSIWGLGIWCEATPQGTLTPPAPMSDNAPIPALQNQESEVTEDGNNP